MVAMRMFDCSRGIDLGPPKYSLPDGALRRLAGASRFSGPAIHVRPGSDLWRRDVDGASISVADAHSMHYNDQNIIGQEDRYVGAGTVLYIDGNSAITGLDGTRLAFVTMPRHPGEQNYIYFTGGGGTTGIRKHLGGSIFARWGIEAGAVPTLANGGATDPVAAGVYQVSYSYVNSDTGDTLESSTMSDPGLSSDGNPPSITMDGTDDLRVTIPASTDAQVDYYRLWITEAGGDVLYFLKDILVASSPYDITATDLLSLDTTRPMTVQQTAPGTGFRDCVGPHAKRVWLADNEDSGERARVYFSFPNEPEYMEGFIEIASDDEPVRKLIIYAGSIYAFTHRAVYEIVNENQPFVYRRVPGAPGIVNPLTAAASPFGIFYVAHDGLYLFDGSFARLVTGGLNGLNRILSGEVVDKDYDAFEPDCATWVRDEYHCSDGVRSFAYSPRLERWREIGLGINAYFIDAENNAFVVATADKVLDIEREGDTDDDGDSINLDVEWRTLRAPTGQTLHVQMVYVHAVLADYPLAVRVTIDGIEYDWGEITNGFEDGEFAVLEVPIERTCTEFTFRLTGPSHPKARIDGIEVVFEPAA